MILDITPTTIAAALNGDTEAKRVLHEVLAEASFSPKTGEPQSYGDALDELQELYQEFEE
jgi:hypothetical protein